MLQRKQCKQTLYSLANSASVAFITPTTVIMWRHQLRITHLLTSVAIKIDMGFFCTSEKNTCFMISVVHIHVSQKYKMWMNIRIALSRLRSCMFQIHRSYTPSFHCKDILYCGRAVPVCNPSCLRTPTSARLTKKWIWYGHKCRDEHLLTMNRHSSHVSILGKPQHHI